MLELVCKILVWLKTHLSHEVETSTHRRETRERPSKEVIWVKNGDVLYLSLPCAREKISYWNNGGAGTSGPTKLATPKIRPIDVNQEKIVGEIDSEILILLQRPD